jgi:hypothetical protein
MPDLPVPHLMRESGISLIRDISPDSGSSAGMTEQWFFKGLFSRIIPIVAFKNLRSVM